MSAEDAYARIEGAVFGEKKHLGFVNSLAVDADAEFLLAGGADSALSIWSMATAELAAFVPRHAAHQFGVSRAMWWPGDSSAFVSGSFDGKVTVWDTETLEQVYTFNMEHKVYNVDLELQSQKPLLAVAMDHPMIRIVDLQSGGASHTLKGHDGRVLSVKWSPNNSNLLASAGSDGTVRVWDIRRANAWVASMDMQRTSSAQALEPLDFRRAHRSAVNGLVWTPLGTTLTSLGNDNKARVWNLAVPGGVNENLNFGPQVQNRHLQNLDPCLSPPDDLVFDNLFICSDTGDVLMFEHMQGRLVKRLIPPEGERSSRQACIVPGRAGSYTFYSGSGTGSIIKWAPPEDDQGVDLTEPEK